MTIFTNRFRQSISGDGISLPFRSRRGPAATAFGCSRRTMAPLSRLTAKSLPALDRGQFYETVLSQPASIVASQGILLAQFAQSSGVDQTTGDPFLMLVPPYETFGRHYILGTQSFYSYYTDSEIDPYDSYLSVVVDSAHTAEVSSQRSADRSRRVRTHRRKWLFRCVDFSPERFNDRSLRARSAWGLDLWLGGLRILRIHWRHVWGNRQHHGQLAICPDG